MATWILAHNFKWKQKEKKEDKHVEHRQQLPAPPHQHCKSCFSATNVSERSISTSPRLQLCFLLRIHPGWDLNFIRHFLTSTFSCCRRGCRNLLAKRWISWGGAELCWEHPQQQRPGRLQGLHLWCLPSNLPKEWNSANGDSENIWHQRGQSWNHIWGWGGQQGERSNSTSPWLQLYFMLRINPWWVFDFI